MRFAKLVFLIAGIYGLIVMLPQCFLEKKTGNDFPPSITHPEFFYGFIGVTVAWQVLFLILSRDPERYRPMMLAGILEKFSFAIAIGILYFDHRVSPLVLAPATIDLLFGILFFAAFRMTSPKRSQ